MNENNFLIVTNEKPDNPELNTGFEFEKIPDTQFSIVKNGDKAFVFSSKIKASSIESNLGKIFDTKSPELIELGIYLKDVQIDFWPIYYLVDETDPMLHGRVIGVAIEKNKIATVDVEDLAWTLMTSEAECQRIIDFLQGVEG